MAPILDGLLDPELDLQLMSLSLNDARTHATLTNISIVRPSTPSTPHTSLFLWVPLLRIPWAASLAQLVHQHLSLRLVVGHYQDDAPSISSSASTGPAGINHSFSPTTTMTDTDISALDTSQLLHLLNNNSWRSAVHLLYPPLPHSLRLHNQNTLEKLRARHKHPRPLERLAIYARIAFANNLLSSLADIVADLRFHCPGTDTHKNKDDSNRNVEQPAETCCSGNSTAVRSRGIDIHITEPQQQICDIVPSHTRKTHDYIGKSCSIECFEKSKSSTTSYSSEKSIITGRKTSRSRSRTSRPRVTVMAHSLPSPSSSSGTLSSAVSDVLAHGVVIRGEHFNCVHETIRSRYGIEIARCSSTSTLSNNLRCTMAPTLSSISNRGTALLQAPGSPPCSSSSASSTSSCSSLSFSPTCTITARSSSSSSLSSSPRSWMSSSSSSAAAAATSTLNCNKKADVEIDDYLRDAFATTWRQVVAKATAKAQRVMVARIEEETILAQRAVCQLTEFRDGLVQRALALDVAGATLARISAIAVVQAGLTHQVTELYKQTLDEARCKVDALSRRDCRQAAKLVGSVGSD